MKRTPIKKCKLAGIVAFFLAFALFSGLVFAAEQIKVVVNGTPVEFDVSPTIVEGTVYVPIRAVYEALGYRLDWYNETKSINITKEDPVTGQKERFIVQIGNKVSWIMGGHIRFEAVPIVIESRTLVPVKFIADSVNAQIEWLQETGTILITK